MRFLLDQNRSPSLADALRAAGHDAIHTEDLGLELAEDLAEGAVVIVTDERIRIRRLPLLHTT